MQLQDLKKAEIKKKKAEINGCHEVMKLVNE